jgi:lipopolysaccharide transport system permease protein
MKAISTKTIIEPRHGWTLIDWKEAFQYKDLLYLLVLRDLTVIYKQTVLGFSWAIIRPFFAMVVFSVVFGRLAKVPSDGIPYPIFSYAALLPWTYFSTALTASTQSLITQANVFTKVYFPRLFIPMTPTLSKLADFGIAFLLLAGMMVYYHVLPNRNIIFLPFLILVLIIAASGFGIWLSALAIQYRDVKHAIDFLIQFMLFGAPVVWPASLIPQKYRLLYGLYPMAGIIEGFRSALIGTRKMPWDLLAVGTVSSLLIAFTGILYFKRTEHKFADIA